MKKILIIEDFAVMQEMYRDVFEKAGHKVIFARDGTDALVLVKDGTYDFIFVDMLLPAINGIEFLEKFRDRPAHTKVYALSDFSEPHTIERAKELGVVDYLRKTDYPPTKLVELVDGKSPDEADG